MNIASSVVNEQNADMASMNTENVLDLFALGDGDPSDTREAHKDRPCIPVSTSRRIAGSGQHGQ